MHVQLHVFIGLYFYFCVRVFVVVDGWHLTMLQPRGSIASQGVIIKTAWMEKKKLLPPHFVYECSKCSFDTVGVCRLVRVPLTQLSTEIVCVNRPHESSVLNIY